MRKGMARTRPRSQLPEAGAAFAVPLKDGRFSVCRVLLDTGSEQSKQWGSGYVLVAGSAWIGDKVPSPDDPILRPILRLNHHIWRDELNVLWVSGRPPDEFIPIGHIRPTSVEKAIQRASIGYWENFSDQPLWQWRWDNERDAVLAEDAIEEREEAERREEARRAREEYLRRITLDELRKHRFFGRWKNYPSQEAIRESRKIMAVTVVQLLELGPSSPEADRIAVLRKCIESFNELDVKLRFIETGERENICEEFEAIVHACGLGARENLADNWRDW